SWQGGPHDPCHPRGSSQKAGVEDRMPGCEEGLERRPGVVSPGVEAHTGDEPGREGRRQEITGPTHPQGVPRIRARRGHRTTDPRRTERPESVRCGSDSDSDSDSDSVVAEIEQSFLMTVRDQAAVPSCDDRAEWAVYRPGNHSAAPSEPAGGGPPAECHASGGRASQTATNARNEPRLAYQA